MKLGRPYRLLLATTLAAGSLLFTRPAAAIDMVYVDDGIVTGREGEAGTSVEGEARSEAAPVQAEGTSAAPERTSTRVHLLHTDGKSGIDEPRMMERPAPDPSTLELQIRADEAAAQRASKAAEEARENIAYLETETRHMEAQQKLEEALAEKERQDALLKAEQQRAQSEKKTLMEREKENRKVEKEQKRSIQKARFQEIGRDKEYVYYMNMNTARYVQPARSTSERVMDVWIKLIEQPVPEMTNPDDLTDHYYLEHYYISPQRKAIQFLAELEVAGRPQNTIRDRAYRVDQWEPLIPGSVEETIYLGAVAKMRDATKFGGRGSTPSLRDMVEEYLRISL